MSAGTGGPIGVLLVDDDPAVLAGAGAVLDGADGIVVLGGCQSGVEAVESAARLGPDDGAEASTLILDAQPDIGVLLHTGTPRGRWAQEALRVGASDIAPKTGVAATLVFAVRRVYERDRGE